MPDHEKICPDCAETIKAAAKLCRFCGHRFDGEEAGDLPNGEAPVDEAPISAAPQRKPFFGRVFDADVGGTTSAGCSWVVIVGGLSLLIMGAVSVHNDRVAREHEQQTPISTSVANPTDGGDSPAESITNQAIDAQVQAETNLKADIKDADSAKFRNEYVARLPGGNLMLCGEVNSKNGFGAYTGFKRFIASPNADAPNLIEGETMAGEDGSDRAFGQAYKVACGNPVKRVD